jgi:hypothetical protein
LEHIQEYDATRGKATSYWAGRFNISDI